MFFINENVKEIFNYMINVDKTKISIDVYTSYLDKYELTDILAAVTVIRVLNARC